MTKTNEALAKAAEEKTQGLATAEPLQVIEVSRNSTGLVKRNTTYNILMDELAAMSGAHEAAPDQIEKGYRLRATRQTEMKTPRYDERIQGGRHEDSVIADLDFIQRFDDWCSFCPSRMRSALLDILIHGGSFQSIGLAMQRDRETIKRWSLRAVCEWVKCDPKKNDKPLIPAKPTYCKSEFVATKFLYRDEHGRMVEYKPYILVDSE